MSQNQSYAAFQRSLENCYLDFHTTLHQTMDSFAYGPKVENRKSANQGLLRAARDLHDFLHESDRPQWLKGILQASQAYHQNQDDARSKQFFNAVAKHFQAIQPIQLIEGQTPSFDFDSLYEKHRDAGQLPDLFDKLIKLANQMIDSGEIESITALEAMKKLIETLKANRDGSYLAARQSVSLASYLKNLADVVLEKVPVLAEIREAWDRTVDEANAEFVDIEQKLRDETLEAIKEQLPRIDRLPHFGEQTAAFVSPLALPTPDASDDDEQSPTVLLAPVNKHGK